MSAKSPSTAKCSRSAASPRRCSPRTAAAWAASSCRWGTAGRSTRTSTTASGARSSSTTSRGPRSWVHLALHREEVVEPHPEQPRARGQHPRNASSAVSPAASNRAMNTSSNTRSRKRRGHRQHDREKWLESNPDGVLQDGRIRSIGRQVRTDRGGLIDLVGVDRDGSVCNRRYGLNGTPFDDRTPRFRRMVTTEGLFGPGGARYDSVAVIADGFRACWLCPRPSASSVVRRVRSVVTPCGGEGPANLGLVLLPASGSRGP